MEKDGSPQTFRQIHVEWSVPPQVLLSPPKNTFFKVIPRTPRGPPPTHAVRPTRSSFDAVAEQAAVRPQATRQRPRSQTALIGTQRPISSDLKRAPKAQGDCARGTATGTATCPTAERRSPNTPSPKKYAILSVSLPFCGRLSRPTLVGHSRTQM